MGEKIDREFPRKGSEIAHIFLLVGLTRICSEHGSDAALMMLEDLAERLRNGELEFISSAGHEPDEDPSALH